MNVEYKRKFLIDTAFITVIAAIAFFVLKFCTIYLLPFLIGLLLAIIVQKPATFVAEKTRLKKGLLSVVFVVILYLITISLISFICVFAYNKISGLVSSAPSYLSTLGNAFGGFSTEFSDIMSELPEEVSKAIKELPDTLIKKATELLTTLLSTSATAVAKNVPGLLVTVIVTVVASCYLSKDYDVVMSFVHKNISSKANTLISEIKRIFFNSILKLGKSYVLIMMITFAELSVGLLIIGVGNPVSTAAIIAFVDILPVLGTGAVVIPWAIISLVTGNVWRGIGLALLYLIITVVRNFIEPKIIGDQVGLHPLITLLAMFVGLRLFGVLGMFVCPILIIILYELERSGTTDVFGRHKEKP